MIFDADYEQRKASWSDIHQHLPQLHAEVLSYPHAVVIELGVRSGNSTAAFLAGVESVDGHLWSVDVEWPDVPSWWSETAYWTFLKGSDLDEFVLSVLPPQADIVFIDTSHTYEQTTAELAAYWPRVKPGGVVLLHDTELSGPDMSWAKQEQPPFPVKVAVDEFCAGVDVVPEYVTGCYGLGVIRKG